MTGDDIKVCCGRLGISDREVSDVEADTVFETAKSRKETVHDYHILGATAALRETTDHIILIHTNRS